MLTQYQKLKEILREMFQMDQADLDFGIYRIMNAKRDEIEKFLDDELLPQVKDEFTKYRGSEIEDKKKELAILEKTIQESGMNPDDSPKVKLLRDEIAKYGDDDVLANEVFSHLSSFFRRYYDNGDFLSLRRYKKDTYAIPYEGEEVKLHWANTDQYYIKTSEYLRDYTFKLSDNKHVHFKLIDATQEKDNIKTEVGKERRFKLHEDDPIYVDGKNLFIQFVYLPDKEKQENHNKRTLECLKAEFGKKIKEFDELFLIAPTEKNQKRTLIEKHLASYTARFNFDFFIHKDLGGFLNRELDFYIKNEVLFVDDLDAQDEKKLKSTVARVKVIKHVAVKVIAFLAQLENFQKKLWLKKKFVTACGYCITLDRVPEKLYTEIVKNDSQIKEWIEFFSIDEIQGDLAKPGYSSPLTVDFLKSNPYLVLDTKHFNEQFKEKLLANFDNLDKAIDGVLINSENFQALNLLNEKYREKVKCIYIDPPFNLGENPDYVYKVDYKDSSWLSLLSDRISISKDLFHNEGSIFVRCNHDGNMILRLMLNDVLGSANYRNEIILRRAEESKGDLNKQFAGVKTITVNYDNIYWYSKKPDTRFGRFLKPTSAEQGEAHWHSFWKAEDRPNMRYELLGIDLRNHYGQWMWEINRATKAKENYEEYEKISKKTGESLEDYWRRTGESLQFIKRDGNGYSSIKYWINPREFVMADNNWLDIKGSSNNWGFKTENSEILLKRIIESLTKEGDLICDFFVGSGTTAASAQKMKRKWICVEMGEHFHTVILPRLKQVLYGESSGISKEVNWKGGGCVKYLRLEGYDDTLDNLVTIRTEDQQRTLEKMGKQVREEYMISYLLDIETKASVSLLNIDRFSDPFNYSLKIRNDNELKDQKIDIVETFNYLVGLFVEQIEMIRGFKVVRGKLRTGEKTLIIWRNLKEKSNDDLNEFFKKQKYNTLDFEFDVIFVNGDNNLENLKVAEDKWKVRLIEEEFKRRMFEQVGV